MREEAAFREEENDKVRDTDLRMDLLGAEADMVATEVSSEVRFLREEVFVRDEECDISCRGSFLRDDLVRSLLSLAFRDPALVFMPDLL